MSAHATMVTLGVAGVAAVTLYSESSGLQDPDDSTQPPE
jgi:hypothetical protein